jgi:hypothetical protein
VSSPSILCARLKSTRRLFAASFPQLCSFLASIPKSVHRSFKEILYPRSSFQNRSRAIFCVSRNDTTRATYVISKPTLLSERRSLRISWPTTMIGRAFAADLMDDCTAMTGGWNDRNLCDWQHGSVSSFSEYENKCRKRDILFDFVTFCTWPPKRAVPLARLTPGLP